jgi:predicted nucleic acid-binding Zn ribbon protein
MKENVKSDAWFSICQKQLNIAFHYEKQEKKKKFLILFYFIFVLIFKF